MYRKLLTIACLVSATMLAYSPTSAAEPTTNQIIELRTYTLVDAAAEAKLDAYLAGLAME